MLSPLQTEHCTLHTVHYTLHTTHYTLYTMHCTLHISHCTLYTTHYTVHTVNCRVLQARNKNKPFYILGFFSFILAYKYKSMNSDGLNGIWCNHFFLQKEHTNSTCKLYEIKALGFSFSFFQVAVGTWRQNVNSWTISLEVFHVVACRLALWSQNTNWRALNLWGDFTLQTTYSLSTQHTTV